MTHARLILFLSALTLGSWLLSRSTIDLTNQYPQLAKIIPLARIAGVVAILGVCAGPIQVGLLKLFKELFSVGGQTPVVRDVVEMAANTNETDRIIFNLPNQKLKAAGGAVLITFYCSVLLSNPVISSQPILLALVVAPAGVFLIVILQTLRWSVEILGDRIAFRRIGTRSELLSSITALEYRDPYTGYIVFSSGPAVKLGPGTPREKIFSAICSRASVRVMHHYQ